MRSVAALVAAAGSGERLGRGPKAFLEISGRTLLEIATDSFRGTAAEIVVAVPEQMVDRARLLVPDATVIVGGADRQATVGAMLAASTSDIVLVHDVARPFLTSEVLDRVLAAVLEEGAATAAIAPADTVLIAADDSHLAREEVRLVQTPQGFRRDLLARAHERAAAEGFLGTDDAGLVRRLGHSVALVNGSPLLAKLTHPSDLPLFEALNMAFMAARKVQAVSQPMKVRQQERQN